jgi:hypothetical protein
MAVKPRTLEAESFVTKPGPTRLEMKRELHKLILAHGDIYGAFLTCNHFLSVVPPEFSSQAGVHAGLDHPLYWPLMTAIVVSYSRPFTDNNGYGVLKKRWSQFNHPKRREAHHLLLKARNELAAHTDIEIRRLRIVPPGRSRFLKGHELKHVGFAVAGYIFTLAQVEIFGHHSAELAQDLFGEVEILLNKLYVDMELPNAPFDLRLNDGL